MLKLDTVKFEPKIIENEDTIIRFSKRNLPLIYTGKSAEENSILTAELYCKWYYLYLVHPDGTIQEIEPALVDDVNYADNVWDPIDIEKFAEKYNLIMDEQFYEMLLGRWEIEIKENY